MNTPPRVPRRRPPARQLLLTAAARIFARDGLEGATTRAIANEAGVNEVTLFRQFGTKEHLLEAVVGKAFGKEEGAPAEAGHQAKRSLKADLELFRQGTRRSSWRTYPSYVQWSGRSTDTASASTRRCRTSLPMRKSPHGAHPARIQVGRGAPRNQPGCGGRPFCGDHFLCRIETVHAEALPGLQLGCLPKGQHRCVPPRNFSGLR